MPPVQAVPAADFDAFVAAVWENAGWPVDATDRGRVTDRDGERRRLLALGGDEPVTADAVRDAATDDLRVTLVAQAGFTERALDVGDAHGVDLVGPDALSRLADATDTDVPINSSRK